MVISNGSNLLKSNARGKDDQRGFSNMRLRKKDIRSKIYGVKKKFKLKIFSPHIRIFSPANTNKNSNSSIISKCNLKPKEMAVNAKQRKTGNLKIKVKKMQIVKNNYFRHIHSPFRESEADSVSSGALNGLTPIKDKDFDSLKFIFGIDEIQKICRQNRRGTF
jgi:hypothetical protein